MVRVITGKDLLELIRDGRLLWAGGLVIVLLLTALAVGTARQREVAAERMAAQALDYQDWRNQPARHPHDAAEQGMHVFKPDPALSIVDPGIDPYVGATIWLKAHSPSTVNFRPAQDATGLQRFGELSPAWVLQILSPLLVIVLGFNAFAAEREKGTLRQTLSLGVSPARLLWGKALAVMAALALLLAPAGLAAGLAVSAAGGGSGLNADTLTRFLWLAGGYSIYLGAAVFVVLAVSALAPSSRVALVVLLGLWIGSASLAPRVASDLSRDWYPNPSRLTFNADLGADMGREARRAWMEQFGTDSRWGAELPLDKWGQALRVDDHAGYAVVDRHFAHLWETFGRQQVVQEWLGLVVPVLAIRAMSMSLAGTDFAHYREFWAAAERQRRVIQDAVTDDLIKNADPRGAGHFDYKTGPAFWATVPQFEYVLPPASWAVRNSLRSFAVLGTGLLLSLALAHVAVMRRAV
jgi:ABC-2 type transport system permease protein